MMKLKKLILALLLVTNSTVVAFAQNGTDVENNEKVEVIVTENTNMYKGKDGYYSADKEVITVIPANSVIYVQDTTENIDYALCKYRDTSGNDIFGYVNKDNIKLFYLLQNDTDAKEKVEVIVTENTNMYKEAYASENKEAVIPANSVIYVQDTTESTDYALCRYRDTSGNDIFGYVNKDNIKLFYLLVN